MDRTNNIISIESYGELILTILYPCHPATGERLHGPGRVAKVHVREAYSLRGIMFRKNGY